MKIVKKIDPSNRVVIPTDARKVLNVGAGDKIEFIIEDNRVELRKPDYDADKVQRQIAAEQLRKYGYVVPPEFL